MEDKLKKSLLTAIGAASIAAGKANKVIGELAKKGLISTKESRALAGKLIKEAEIAGKRVEKIFSAELKKQVRKAKPIISKGKKAAKEAISATKKTIKEAQRTAEKRGKSIVKAAAKRLS